MFLALRSFRKGERWYADEPWLSHVLGGLPFLWPQHSVNQFFNFIIIISVKHTREHSIANFKLIPPIRHAILHLPNQIMILPTWQNDIDQERVFTSLLFPFFAIKSLTIFGYMLLCVFDCILDCFLNLAPDFFALPYLIPFDLLLLPYSNSRSQLLSSSWRARH